MRELRGMPVGAFPDLQRFLELSWDGIAGLGRAFVLLPVALASLPAATVDIYGLGVSIHYSAQDRAELEGWNPGAGIGVSETVGDGWELTAMAVTYRDSYGKMAMAGGGGARFMVGEPAAWHGTGGLLLGLLNGSGSAYTAPVLAPVVGVGYDRVNLELIAGPDTVALWVRVAWLVP